MSYDYLFKFILIGDTGVGKTSYSDRLVHNRFHASFIPTLGVDFYAKNIELDDNTVIKSQIWDTAGQEKFAGIISHYYKGIAGAIIMFDITNKHSYNRVNHWKKEIELKSGVNSYNLYPILLIGNKIDNKNRAVSRDEAEGFALNNGMLYEEVSCKKKKNIEMSFKRIVKEVYIKMDQNNLGPGIRRHFSQENIYTYTGDLNTKECKRFSCCTII